MNVLAISYGRGFFDENNPERKRMEACANSVDSYHMVIFTLEKDGYSHTEAKSGLTLYPTNSKSKLHMIFDAIKIARAIIKDLQGQCVVTSQDPFEAGLVGYVVSRSPAVPFNIQEHGDFFSTPYWRQDLFLNGLRFVFAKWLLHKADTVRVVSKRIQRTMIALGIPATKVLYLPVRTDSITQNRNEEISLRAQYPDASVIVLSMSRLVSQKNIALSIRAFNTLKSNDPQARMVIVGSGPKQKELKELVNSLDLQTQVFFQTWTESPFELMSSADVFILSSNWEGWARVLVEAMIAGTPVVTTDVGCAGEVLIDGVHGFVVAPRDEKTFTEKLVLLAQNQSLREKFSEQAKRDVVGVHQSEVGYVEHWSKLWDATKTIFDDRKSNK